MVAWCRRWNQSEPGNAAAWFYLGCAYQDLGIQGDAMEAFHKAVRLKPDFAEAWNSLGNSYVSVGGYRTAIGAYREALSFKPDYAAAWWGLGGSYARTGNRSAALEAVKELRRYNPQKADELSKLIDDFDPARPIGGPIPGDKPTKTTPKIEADTGPKLNKSWSEQEVYEGYLKYLDKKIK
jgi:tetratricopeptide (TPR) repeat protein